MKKVIGILGNVFTVLLLVFSISLTVIVITSTRDEDRIPSAFGYALFNVETDSMSGENGFEVGDLIIIQKLSDEECDQLKIGDVVTYRRIFEGAVFLDTHRIVPITEEIARANFGRSNLLMNEVSDGVWIHGGIRNYITQGDNTDGLDYQEDGSLQFSTKDNIVGTWTGTRIPKLGAALKFMKSQMGFMICVVLPVALFFMYELYVFIATLMAKKKEDALAAVAGKEEELKAAAVAEFLAQQQKSAGETAKEETKPVEESKPVEEKKPEPKAEEKSAEISEEEKAKIIAEYMAKQAEEMRKKESENS